VITFTPEATPFPGVDTNAILFFIVNRPPCREFHFVTCQQAHTQDLRNWVEGKEYENLRVITRALDEGLQTGFSRPPIACNATPVQGLVLGDFVRVMRGIATGDNDFFFMTSAQAKQIGIPKEFLKVAVGRTRDIENEVITDEDVKRLDQSGRPTLLLSLDNSNATSLPDCLQDYLKKGEEKGLPKRALISTRQPWYKMEQRTPPPFLFAYLGRRNTRFIRNDAKVLPLTSFLCIYPKQNTESHLATLWLLLQNPETVANLSRIGKSYGSGAIKVEPRALEQLPLPMHLVEELGLLVPRILLEKAEEPYTLRFDF
jgi:hypothetical protein